MSLQHYLVLVVAFLEYAAAIGYAICGDWRQAGMWMCFATGSLFAAKWSLS